MITTSNSPSTASSSSIFKKKFLLWGSLIICVVVAAVASAAWFLNGRVIRQQPLDDSIFRVKNPLEVEIPPNFEGTGAVGSDSTAEPWANNAALLVTKLPLSFGATELAYSFQEDVFVVTVCPPTEEGVNSVRTWLKEQQFDNIPTEKFRYNVQPTCDN